MIVKELGRHPSRGAIMQKVAIVADSVACLPREMVDKYGRVADKKESCEDLIITNF